MSDNLKQEQLTIERIYSSPSLNGHIPKSITLSPDGTRVTYLQSTEDDLTRYNLWEYFIATKEHKLLVDSKVLFADAESLSPEEKARRERQRIHGVGIMEYFFSPDGSALLFPVNGDIYYYHIATKLTEKLTQTASFETDIKFSPTGKYISYIREQNIYILEIATKKERQLTLDGAGTIKNGMSEFVAQEEMDRMTGYWWAPNEKNIAFLRVDETPVKTVTHHEIHADNIEVVNQRYPTTGTNNVNIQLAVTDIKNNKTRFIELGDNTDIYIPRVQWLNNGDDLSYQLQSRDQKSLTLKVYNLKKRRQKNILTETSTHWLNLHNDLTFLKESNSFIWSSERDGYKHLYQYNLNGKLIAQLTKGLWVVDSLKYVDEKNGWVYFTARADTPLERHLYKVPLANKSPENVQRITTRSGFHDINFANNGETYIDTYSNIKKPTQVSLHLNTGEHISWLAKNNITNKHPIAPYQQALVSPEFGAVKADDGKTDLYYKLYKPQNMVPGKKYPVIVRVYGGPQAQLVTNSWEGVDMTQYLLQRGYIVYQLDNRGSYARGTEFEFPLYETLGEVELADQITGVKFLHSLPYVDKNRIGILGHSYGGYMTLMAMFKASSYFKAGVSGAPVTDWLLYDTHYTERYLNHPEQNPTGYEKSSVFPYISGLKGDLLVYHGMADDNVLFTHTTKLTKALQDQGKLFELMPYPSSKHSMQGQTVKVHLTKTIVDFFDRHFK